MPPTSSNRTPKILKPGSKAPDFTLKSTPDLFAQKTMTQKIMRGDKDSAKWWLERRKKKEFGNNVDVTTNGKDLPTPILGGLTKEDGDDSKV